jgi:hypothetical protein
MAKKNDFQARIQGLISRYYEPMPDADGCTDMPSTMHVTDRLKQVWPSVKADDVAEALEGLGYVIGCDAEMNFGWLMRSKTGVL